MTTAQDGSHMQDDQQREKIDSVIEMAMSRLGQRSPANIAEDDRRQQERLDLGRRDYDVALAKRLDELRSVMGNEAALPRGFRTGTLLAAALFSAAAGAGAMWLAIGGNPQPAAAPAAPPTPLAVAAPAVVVAPAAFVPAPKPTDEERVRALIDTWRSAWAGRDVDAYLACYRADFTPASGQKHDRWAAARRKNISTRSSITVATNDLALERLDEQRMKASFLQDYASGGYRETGQAKTLLLVRNETGWKIAGEWQGQAPASALGKP
ncbi:MAG: hypothetical protein HZC22_19200 [Rhodocyclales bacterium]|nr:hypothetical protein [Rhodocyclales bacterium]